MIHLSVDEALDMWVPMIGANVRHRDGRTGRIVNAFRYQKFDQRMDWQIVCVLEILVAQGKSEIWEPHNVAEVS